MKAVHLLDCNKKPTRTRCSQMILGLCCLLGQTRCKRRANLTCKHCCSHGWAPLWQQLAHAVNLCQISKGCQLFHIEVSYLQVCILVELPKNSDLSPRYYHYGRNWECKRRNRQRCNNWTISTETSVGMKSDTLTLMQC